MDDILKYDVRAYVEKLIEKEFLSKNHQEKAFSYKRRTNAGGSRDEQRRPFSLMLQKKGWRKPL
jgi:predicted transcriptional regulator